MLTNERIAELIADYTHGRCVDPWAFARAVEAEAMAELRAENERLRGLLREAHNAIYNEPNDGQLDRLGERIDAALEEKL